MRRKVAVRYGDAISLPPGTASHRCFSSSSKALATGAQQVLHFGQGRYGIEHVDGAGGGIERGHGRLRFLNKTTRTPVALLWCEKGTPLNTSECATRPLLGLHRQLLQHTQNVQRAERHGELRFAAFGNGVDDGDGRKSMHGATGMAHQIADAFRK
ncbi:MAG: hypothetical protein IPG74_19460 [Flavobacteriales bacterium]|nr:hypothetical protein [Flavobacteriales bacterium]